MKRILLIALIPFLIVFAWNLKNWHYYKFFGTSSWLGLSLAKMTTMQLPIEWRTELVKQNKIHISSAVESYGRLWRYGVVDTTTIISRLKMFPNTPKRFIPILDVSRHVLGRKGREELFQNGSNFNHYLYIYLSNKQKEDAMWSMNHYPAWFWTRSFPKAMYTFFMPCNMWFALAPQHSGRRYNVDMMGKHTVYKLPRKQCIGHIMTFVLYCIAIYVACKYRSNIVILFMGYTILFVFLATSCVELGENMRFQFVVAPFMWILCGLGVSKIWERR